MTRTLLLLATLALIVVATPRPSPLPVSPPDEATAGAPQPAIRVKVPQPRVSPVQSVTGGAPLATRIRGTATWCAPTPRYCHGWDTRYVGAVPSFRWGDDPYRVRVCRVGTNRCTEVTVVSYCDCGSTLIDLSVPAFRELAPLSRGRVRVTVRPAERVRLPATDTVAPYQWREHR